jgi:hypothetical protein
VPDPSGDFAFGGMLDAMRTIGISILLALITGSCAYILWRDLLEASPALSKLPPKPTPRQRQFGMKINPLTAAALERTLPSDFTPEPTLGDVLKAMSDEAGVEIFYNLPLSKAGYLPDTAVQVSFANMKLGDALMDLVEWLNSNGGPGVTCYATRGTDGLIFDTLANGVSYRTDGGFPRVYDTRELIDPAAVNSSIALLVTEVIANVEPRTWSRTLPRTIQSMGTGHLIVIADDATQYEVASYLRERSREQRLKRFALRVVIIVGGTQALLAVGLSIAAYARRRRRLSVGLCRKCGYDLRASVGRCPECGTPFQRNSSDSSPDKPESAAVG